MPGLPEAVAGCLREILRREARQYVLEHAGLLQRLQPFGIGRHHRVDVLRLEGLVEGGRGVHVPHGDRHRLADIDPPAVDVRARRVVAGVEADHRPLPQRGHVGVGGAPVRDVGGVERRLEELVLQHESLVLAETGVDLRETLGQPVLAGEEERRAVERVGG